MSLFLSCSRLDLFEIFGDFRLLGKIIDSVAQPADMTLVAHDQMLSDPAQGNSGLLLNQVTNQAFAPIVLSQFG